MKKCQLPLEISIDVLYLGMDLLLLLSYLLLVLVTSDIFTEGRLLKETNTYESYSNPQPQSNRHSAIS